MHTEPVTTRRAVGIVAAGAATVVVLGAVFLAVFMPQSRLTLWSDPVVSEDGRSVTVTISGGQCDDPDADVDESASKVLITVRNEPDWFSRGCTDLGVTKPVTVRLDEPIGDRELLDGALKSSHRS